MAEDKTKNAFDEHSGVPTGRNDLNAFGLFTQRKYYKDVVYPTYTPTPLDLWYDRKYFGKIDTNGNAIFAQQRSLKQLVSSNQNIFALDFVADAFAEFRSRFLFLNKVNASEGPFEKLDPARGWISIEKKYDMYMSNLYERFAVYYMAEQKRDQKLITFDDFMKMFLNFIEENSPHLPITLSQYIYSPLCPPTTSGLMIEISGDEHGNDRQKYENFINHKSFACYTETAEKFGFKIDKNAPQRLIADINSPAMKKYMEVYPKEPKPFIKRQPPTLGRANPPKPPKDPGPVSLRKLFSAVGDNYDVVTMGEIEAAAQLRGGMPVSILVVVPPGDAPWIILRNYTELINRIEPAGSKPKPIDPNRSRAKGFARNELEALIGRFNNPDGAMLLNGTIKAIMPTLEDKRSLGLIPSFDNWSYQSELLEIAAGKKINNIAIVEFKYAPTIPPQEKLQKPWIKSASYDIKSAPWTDEDTYNCAVPTKSKNEGSYKKMRAEGFKGSFLMEVPLDALHLSNRTTLTFKTKFMKNVSFPLRLKDWRQKRNAYMKNWNEKIKPKAEQEIAKYNADLKNYEDAIKLFNNGPRLGNENLMDLRFARAYTTDMFVLKEICLQFYNSYATGKPRTTISEVLRCGNNIFKTKKQIVERQQINRFLISSKYPVSYWLKQYILFRNVELKNKKSPKKIIAIIKQVNSLKVRAGLDEALKYVNDQFKFKIDNT